MEEDLKKNFILLSKVAKKKKYAQEYLGLLARRGDIGSVRIGKRWYTTWAWFEEFLENSQKKKTESVGAIKIAQPVMAEPKKISLAENKEEKIKINVPFVFPEREKVLVAHPIVKTIREEKIAEAPDRIEVAANPQRDQMIVRKNIAVDKIDISLSTSPIRPMKMQTGRIQIRRSATEQIRKAPIQNFAPKRMAHSVLQDEPRLRNSSVEEKNRYAVPYKEVRFKEKTDVFSPDFSEEGEMRVPIFSQFAFAASFAIMVLLVAASGYFIWSGGLLAEGTVAGASDERNVGFSGITSGGDYVLVSAGDKMKETLSVSRVMVQTAKERVNQDNSVN